MCSASNILPTSAWRGHSVAFRRSRNQISPLRIVVCFNCRQRSSSSNSSNSSSSSRWATRRFLWCLAAWAALTSHRASIMVPLPWCLRAPKCPCLIPISNSRWWRIICAGCKRKAFSGLLAWNRLLPPHKWCITSLVPRCLSRWQEWSTQRCMARATWSQMSQAQACIDLKSAIWAMRTWQAIIWTKLSRPHTLRKAATQAWPTISHWTCSNVRDSSSLPHQGWYPMAW